MDKQMKKVKDFDTYELMPLPKGKTVIGTRWVYKFALTEDGEEDHQARWCAQGNKQEVDPDYQQTFVPTAKMTSVRMVADISV